MTRDLNVNKFIWPGDPFVRVFSNPLDRNDPSNRTLMLREWNEIMKLGNLDSGIRVWRSLRVHLIMWQSRLYCFFYLLLTINYRCTEILLTVYFKIKRTTNKKFIRISEKYEFLEHVYRNMLQRSVWRKTNLSVVADFLEERDANSLSSNIHVRIHPACTEIRTSYEY